MPITVQYRTVDTELTKITDKDEVYRIPGYPQLKCRHCWFTFQVTGDGVYVEDIFRESVQDPRWIVEVLATLELVRSQNWKPFYRANGYMHILKNRKDVWLSGQSTWSADSTYIDTALVADMYEPTKMLNYHTKGPHIFYDEDDEFAITVDIRRVGSEGSLFFLGDFFVYYVEKP
jgi:hypothetical protein